MQWLPTYLARNLSADKESISLTALPYIVNSLVGIGEYIIQIKLHPLILLEFLFKRYNVKYNINLLHSFIVAGHSADSLIQKRWSVLSIRRLMTNIGLVGPGAFLLAFCAVDNLLAAVMYV